ncbi:MAG: POTRA domain-containing protein [Candidatus Acidiferrales bacterium]
MLSARFHLLAATIALALLCAASAKAQSAQGGDARLLSVDATGSSRFSSAQVAAATGLHTGESITREVLQAAADRLAHLGPFATVKYRFSSVESGVKVEYQVTDASSVPVVFDNFIWFTDAEIADELKKSVILFDGTAPPNGTLLDEISAALERLLDSRGVHSAVSHALVESPGGSGQVQQFEANDVDVRISSVQFPDSLASNDPGIRDRLSDLTGKPYSRTAIILFEQEQVRPVYIAHAYLQVHFEPPKATFAANPAKPVPDSVAVLAPIDPGARYIFAGVKWIGNTALPSNQLNMIVAIKPGEPADGMKITGAWDNVREGYSRAGYLDATVSPQPEFDDKTAHVSYDVTIVEGPQYRMGNLVLTGLSVEGERRIRAAWALGPGAVFDETYLANFLSSGVKQAFGDLPVHYEKIGHFLQKDPKSGKVDVLIDFQ